MNESKTEALERRIIAQQKTIDALMDAADGGGSTSGTSFAIWQEHVGLARVVDRKTHRLREALEEIQSLHASLTEKTEELEEAASAQRAIVEALDANVCILDEHGAVIETNAYWGAMAAQDAGVRAAVDAILAGSDRIHVLDTPCRGPDERWFQVRVSPLPSGVRGRVMIAYIDVTNLLATQEALAAKSEEADMLALVARHTDSAVVIIDPDGLIRWVNESFTLVNGYSEAEAIGKRPMELLHTEEERARLEPQILEHISCGRGFGAEVTCHAKDGRAYPAELEIRPVRDRDGSLRRVVAISKDITARKDGEARLAQAERLESIGQLAAGVAHEINTPMQYIGDNLTFLARAVDFVRPVAAALETPGGCDEARELIGQPRFQFIAQRAPRAIEQALEGVEAVSKIVRAMKAVSHMGGDDEQSLTDLNQCVETALTVSRNEWKYVAEVETHLAEDLPQILADAGALNQVVLNLLVNAGHAIGDRVSGDERGRITVTTRCAAAGDEIVLEVADTGTGMRPEVAARIFDPFYTTKGVGRGTGQGLTLARNIVVKRYGGSIDVATALGEGTVFTVRLPTSGRRRSGGEEAA